LGTKGDAKERTNGHVISDDDEATAAASVGAQGCAAVRRGGAVQVDPWLETAWFQPFNLKCDDFLVSCFAFKFNLYRYTEAQTKAAQISADHVGMEENPLFARMEENPLFAAQAELGGEAEGGQPRRHPTPQRAPAPGVFVEGPMRGGADPYRDEEDEDGGHGNGGGHGASTMMNNKAGLEALLAVNTPGIGPVPPSPSGGGGGGGGGSMGGFGAMDEGVPGSPLARSTSISRLAGAGGVPAPPKDVFLAWVPARRGGGGVGGGGDDGDAPLADKVVPIASLCLNPSDPNALLRTTATTASHSNSSGAGASGASGASGSSSTAKGGTQLAAAGAGKQSENNAQPKSGKSGKAKSPKQQQQQQQRQSSKQQQQQQRQPSTGGSGKSQQAVEYNDIGGPEGFFVVPTFKASSLLPFESVVAGDPDAETLDFDFDLIAEKGSRAAALSACAVGLAVQVESS
jgi:hypothetical protein